MMCHLCSDGMRSCVRSMTDTEIVRAHGGFPECPVMTESESQAAAMAYDEPEVFDGAW